MLAHAVPLNGRARLFRVAPRHVIGACLLSAISFSLGPLICGVVLEARYAHRTAALAVRLDSTLAELSRLKKLVDNSGSGLGTDLPDAALQLTLSTDESNGSPQSWWHKILVGFFGVLMSGGTATLVLKEVVMPRLQTASRLWNWFPGPFETEMKKDDLTFETYCFLRDHGVHSLGDLCDPELPEENIEPMLQQFKNFTSELQRLKRFIDRVRRNGALDLENAFKAENSRKKEQLYLCFAKAITWIIVTASVTIIIVLMQRFVQQSISTGAATESHTAQILLLKKRLAQMGQTMANIDTKVGNMSKHAAKEAVFLEREIEKERDTRREQLKQTMARIQNIEVASQKHNADMLRNMSKYAIAETSSFEREMEEERDARRGQLEQTFARINNIELARQKHMADKLRNMSKVVTAGTISLEREIGRERDARREQLEQAVARVNNIGVASQERTAEKLRNMSKHMTMETLSLKREIGKDRDARRKQLEPIVARMDRTEVAIQSNTAKILDLENLVSHVVYKGWQYATLDLASPRDAEKGGQCQEETCALALPSSWELVPFDPDIASHVVAPYPWGTPELLFSNGAAYQTSLGSHPGDSFDTANLLTTTCDGVSCYYPIGGNPKRILMRKYIQ